MPEQITLTEEQQNQVQRLSLLIKARGYEKYGNFIYSTIIADHKIINVTSRNTELAQLILVLRKYQEMTIKGTSAYPNANVDGRQGQIYGVKLTNRYVLDHLERWANTFLNDDACGFDKIGIPYKEADPDEAEHTLPFSNSELYDIIEFEKGVTYAEPIAFTQYGAMGQKFWEWNKAFSEAGIFTADKLKKETGVAKGKSAEYEFLFDCYDIIYGIETPYPLITKEKYDEVRKCIASYETTMDKNRE